MKNINCLSSLQLYSLHKPVPGVRQAYLYTKKLKCIFCHRLGIPSSSLIDKDVNEKNIEIYYEYTSC